MKESGKKQQTVRYDLSALRIGIASQFTARVAAATTSLLLAILYVRILDASEYAAYASAIAMAGLLVQLTSTGLERLVFRYAPASAEAGLLPNLVGFFRSLLAVRIATTLLGVGVTAFSWQWLCGVFNLPAELLYVILILAIAQTLVAHWLAILQVLMRQRAIAFSVSLVSLAKLLLAGGLAINLGKHFSTTEALAVLAVSEVLTSVMFGCQHWAYMRKCNGFESPRGNHTHMLPSPSEAAHFVIGNYGMNQLSTVLNPRVQILVASAVLPDVAVAGYAFVRNLVEQLALFMPSRAFRQLFEPLLMGRYRDGKNQAEIAASLTLLTKTNLGVITPIAILFAIGGAYLLGFLTGGKYVEQSILMALLLYGLVVSTYRTSVGVLINASGNVNIIVLAAVAGASLVVLCLWLPLAEHGVWLLALTELAYTGGFLFVVRLQRTTNHAGHWAPLRLLASSGLLYAGASVVGILIAILTGDSLNSVSQLTLWAGAGCFGLLATRLLCTCSPQEIERITRTVPGFLAPVVRKIVRQRPR